MQKSTTIAGITLEANITTAQLQAALQDTTHRFVTDAQISNWNARYLKPAGGIPASDLAESYYLASNPNGYTKVEASNTNGNIKINDVETPVYVSPLQDISFTASDAGWSASADANGFYTLTITSAKKPFAVYNSNGEQVLAGLKFDGTYIYVITDTKFTGSVSVR